MSVNFPPSCLWDKNTILTKGPSFLEQKNLEFLFQVNLFQNSDDFNTGLKSFKASIGETSQEIQTLDRAVLNVLHQEIAQNPHSEEVEQLQKIYSASNAAFHYYSNIKDTPEPTIFDSLLDLTNNISMLATSITAILTPCAFLVTKLAGWNFPEKAKLPFQISATLLVALQASITVKRILELNMISTPEQPF